MKFAPLAALAVLLVGAATCVVVLAADPAAPADEKPAATQPAGPTTGPTVSAVPLNKKCPVSGDDVDPKGKTVTYKGKTVGFCCSDCIDLFNKNPDKYADKIK